MLFNRKRKLGKSSNQDDFEDFDLGMDMEDDYEPSADRKPSAKSYVKNYYENKLTDKGEQKRLLKAAMPGSYSTTIDLAADLKNDLSSIRYDVGKEWDKQKAPLKKLLRSKDADSMLKFLRLKKLQAWANEAERGGYSEDSVDQDEANIQNLLSSFNRGGKKDPGQEVENQEREKSAEFRTKSLLTQMRGTASLGAILGELKSHTAYQDQVTYQYQQKSLEFLIRNFVENKKQTEILHTYKEESIAELKEIHKNTGLPEAVKINQSELAGQIFKEKMLGSAVGWFDGKLGTLRGRITKQIRSKLIDMTRNFGSTIEQFNEGIEAGAEAGSSPLRMIAESMIGNQLDKPYNKLMGKATNSIRNRIQQNPKLARLGKTLQALTANAGGLANNALLSGNTGNKLLDNVVSFLGLRSAAITRSNNVRGSLAQNLDMATHMDMRFKHTVERVIPGWLSMIYKESHLIRTGKKEEEFKQQHWDWNKEEFVGEDQMQMETFAKVFKKENVEQMNLAMERLLRHFDPKMILSSAARKELRKWLFEKIRKSILPTLYGLMIEITKFKEPIKTELTMMCEYAGPIFEEDVEDMDGGVIAEGQIISARADTYGRWMKDLAPLVQDVAGKNLFDLKEIMSIAQTTQGKYLEQLGLLKRNSDGSIDIDEDFESDFIDRSAGIIKYRKQGGLRADGTRSVKNRKGKVEERVNWEFDGNEDTLDDILHGEIKINGNDKFAKGIQRWLTQETIDGRNGRARKQFLQNVMGKFPSMTKAEVIRGLKNGTLKFASGGLIPSLASGGSTGNFAIDKGMKVEVHGGEFVSDNQTTEQNKNLLSEMNRLKAKVINKDGSINPIYYKAFGFENAGEFKKALSGFKGKKLQAKKDKLKGFAKAEGAKVKKELERMAKLQMMRHRGFKNAASEGSMLSLMAGGQDIEKIIMERFKTEEEKEAFMAANPEVMKMMEEMFEAMESGNHSKVSGSKIAEGINLVAGRKVLDGKKMDKGIRQAQAKIDLFLGEDRKNPIISATKLFNKGYYIYHGGQKVPYVDLSVPFSILYDADNDKEVVGVDEVIEKGLFTRRGSPFVPWWTEDIDLLELNSFDDAAKHKANRTKDFIKKNGGILADKMRLGKAKDFVEKNWDDVAIDIYLPDSPGEPRLTAANFNAGVYMDKETSRICKTHHDITGAVLIAPHGKYALTAEEFEKGFIDKEGNKITTSALKRYRNIGKEKATAAYNKYAKKHVDKYVAKAADGFLSLSERWMHGFKPTAIDIYAPGSSEPILTAAGFREGKYISTNTKKPITSYLQVDGPLVDNKGNFVLTSEDIEQGVCDKEGKKVTFPKLQSKMGRLLSLAGKALSIDGALKVGKKLWGKAKNWRGTKEELKDKAKGKWFGMGGFEGAKSKLMGNFGKEEGEDGTTYRVGSWQWKRKKKEENGWLNKLGSVIRGDKAEEKGKKKKSWLWKILTGMFTVASFIGKKLFGLGGIITGGLGSLASTLLLGTGKIALRLGTMIVPPILKGLMMLGRKMGGAAFGRGGFGVGRMAKIGGLAAGGYMMYQGLKGEEQLDEQGNPVLDKDGNPVTKTDWGSTAMGAATMAVSTGVGRAALMGGARLALGLLTGPVGWAALGATAAYYGGKALFGWWKKGKALEEAPLTSFRMIQYGFSPTAEACAKPIMEMENYLSGFIQEGQGLNIKADVDPSTIFGFFGLKAEGGDAERNKAFMAWFLGRFKPVYLSYVKQAKKLRNQTDISSLDKDLTPSDKLLLLQGVHFKTQSEMNPYNVMLSPFEDPDETDYDFEDVASKYDEVVENVKASMTEEEKKAAETVSKEDEKKAAEGEKSSAGETLKKVLPAMGIAGASLSVLGFVAKKMGGIFGITVDNMSKSIDEQLSRLTKTISEKWKSLKGAVGSAWDGAKDWASDKAGDIAQGAAGGYAAGGLVGGALGAAAGAVGVYEKLSGTTKDNQLGVYKAFINAGLSDNQARIITAEVGRENSYESKHLFGGHIDPANGKYNLGFLSWQGDRGKNLYNFLNSKGLIQGGKIVQSQAALDAQAQFAVNEIKTISGYGATKRDFLDNPNVSYQKGVEVLGKNYIRWRFTDPAYAGHHKRRDNFYATLNKNIGNSPAKAAGPASVGTNNTPQAAAVGAKPQGVALLTYGQNKGGTSGTSGSSGYSGGGGKTGGAGASGSWEAPKVGSMDGTKGAAATTSAKPSIASNAGLQGLLAQATPELVQAGKSHVRLGAKRVTLSGMNDTFMTLFWAMVGEAKKKGLSVVQINDGFRSYEEQVRLYNLYKQGKGNLAARPGTSRHGYGQAMDINSANADQLIKAGVFAKWGFTRPLLSKGETWHIENKYVPRGKAPATAIEQNKKQNTTSGANPSVAVNTSSGSPSPNPAISSVMNQGGFAATPSVTTAQQQDSMNGQSVNNLLSQQLGVQMQIRDTLLQLAKQSSAVMEAKKNKELEELKKPSSGTEIGEKIGQSIAGFLGEKLGMTPPPTSSLAMNKPKPPISASK